MRSIIKFTILLVVLAIPAVVYLFLKSFGVNEYNIPIFYENGIPFSSCQDDSKPHRVHIPQSFYNGDSSGVVLYFPDLQNKEATMQIDRVKGTFKNVCFLEMSIPDSISENTIFNQWLTRSKFLDFINCELGIGQDTLVSKVPMNEIMLIDREGRIRGYYETDDFEEMDRLIIEIEILIKNVDKKNES